MVDTSPIDLTWLLERLTEAQQAAQARVAEARAANVPVDAFDRDVATWLAAGLRDLLNDAVTGASFTATGTGIIDRVNRDPDTRFEESDFLRPDGIRFLEAGRAAQSMMTKLNLSSTNQYRVAAARVMNALLAQPLAASPSELVPEEPLAASPLEAVPEIPVMATPQAAEIDWFADLDCEWVLREGLIPDQERLLQRLIETWLAGNDWHVPQPKNEREQLVLQSVIDELLNVVLPFGIHAGD